MKKPRRIWRQALDAAAARDAAEGTEAHSNEVIFGMIADMLRTKGSPASSAGSQVEVRYNRILAKSVDQLAVFVRPKAKPPAVLFFTQAKLPRRGGRP